MKKISISTICLTLILTTFATAQFRIKIPKIGKPKIPKIASPKQSMSKDKTRQMVLDDGFTFFDAEVVKGFSTRTRRNTDKGWTMRSHLRLFGDFPRRSGFNVVVSKGGRVLAKTRCVGIQVPDPNSYQVREGLVYGDHYIYTMPNPGCINKKRLVRAIGKLDVLVYFFNGETDEETLVRKYKIDVHKATRVRGPVKRTVSAVPHYYISRHQDVAASIMYLSADHAFNYFKWGSRSSPNQVQIYFNYSPKSSRRGLLPHGRLRCFVNGKFVRIPGSGQDFDRVSPAPLRRESGTYMDRLAAQYKRGGEYKDEVAFFQVGLNLPLSWGRKTSKRQVDRLNIRDYPGRWKCDYRYDGETIRTFRWTVGNDGMPVKHAEQQNGNINLFHNSYLIETEIPAGGSEYDYRLVPMPNEGFFYGRPWTSAEGKAMAAKIPRKGNPYHVPSTRER